MKFTEMTKKIILDNIAIGLTQKDAAVLANVDEVTIIRWKKRYVSFANQMEQKAIECKRRNIGLVQKAAQKSWQAAAWWLERKYKEEFALRHELTGKDGGSIVLSINKDDEAL